MRAGVAQAGVAKGFIQVVALGACTAVNGGTAYRAHCQTGLAVVTLDEVPIGALQTN